jgi:hypothetical protein
MSAIAMFFQLPLGAIEGLRSAAAPKKSWLGKPKDTFWDYLRQHGREVVEYHWSGYVYNSLLVYLEEKHGIYVMKSEYDELADFLHKSRGTSFMILTPALRDAYASRLDPSLFADAELIAYENDFNQTSDGVDLLPAMKDGIDALRKALIKLDDQSITLFIIG